MLVKFDDTNYINPEKVISANIVKGHSSCRLTIMLENGKSYTCEINNDHPDYAAEEMLKRLKLLDFK